MEKPTTNLTYTMCNLSKPPFYNTRPERKKYVY